VHEPNGNSLSLLEIDRIEWLMVSVKMARVLPAGITMFAFQRKLRWTHAIVRLYMDDTIRL